MSCASDHRTAATGLLGTKVTRDELAKRWQYHLSAHETLGALGLSAPSTAVVVAAAPSLYGTVQSAKAQNVRTVIIAGCYLDLRRPSPRSTGPGGGIGAGRQRDPVRCWSPNPRTWDHRARLSFGDRPLTSPPDKPARPTGGPVPVVRWPALGARGHAVAGACPVLASARPRGGELASADRPLGTSRAAHGLPGPWSPVGAADS